MKEADMVAFQAAIDELRTVWEEFVKVLTERLRLAFPWMWVWDETSQAAPKRCKRNHPQRKHNRRQR